jgi:glycosyltransferase involved in cell wall biosynthesis
VVAKLYIFVQFVPSLNGTLVGIFLGLKRRHQMPEISIVMPTYNQGEFICDTIDSILAQTFRDFELIIVDDASTDGTFDLVKERYSDPRIRLFKHDWCSNKGTGVALNTGFFMARGEIETWFASDKIMYPNCLEVLHAHLESHPSVEFVYSNCEIWVMDDSGKNATKKKNLVEEVLSQDWDPERFNHHYFLGIFWLWRKELRIRAGGLYQPQPCEDYDMARRMVMVDGSFAYVPECLGWFRRHKKNLSYQIRGNHGNRSTFYYDMVRGAT